MTRRMQTIGEGSRATKANTVVGQRAHADRQLLVAPHRGSGATAPVACCLSRELLGRFLVRVPNAILAQQPEELLELALAERVRLVVADPSAGNSECTRTLLRIRKICPATLIAVYTSLRPSVMSDIVELAQHGVQDVIIYGTDDTRSRFDELMERGAALPLTGAVVQLLESNLRLLRPTLAAAVKEMFDSPRRLASVPQLAAAGGMTRRSLYRHLAAAGFHSPRLLVASARVVRAAHVLAHSELTVREVALSLGFSKPDIMTLQVVSLTGLRPRQLRDSKVLATVPGLIVSRLCSITHASGGVSDANAALPGLKTRTAGRSATVTGHL